MYSVLPCKLLPAKLYNERRLSQYEYNSPEECAYEALKNNDGKDPIGVTNKSDDKKCWIHDDMSIPLGRWEGTLKACQFEGNILEYIHKFHF